MHVEDSDSFFTFVNGAMLPQYSGKNVIIAGQLTDLAARNCKMITTDGLNVNIQVDSSEDMKLGFYEFHARVLSATTVKSISRIFFEDEASETNRENTNEKDTMNKYNKDNYNKLCKLMQMVPDVYDKEKKQP